MEGINPCAIMQRDLMAQGLVRWAEYYITFTLSLCMVLYAMFCRMMCVTIGVRGVCMVYFIVAINCYIVALLYGVVYALHCVLDDVSSHILC